MWVTGRPKNVRPAGWPPRWTGNDRDLFRRFEACLLLAGVLTLVAAVPVSAAELSVNITAPSAGDAVSGPQTLKAETTGSPLSVAFTWSKDGGVSWRRVDVDSTPADGWSTVWDTRPYSGPALLRAVASDGSTRAADVLAVTVRNLRLKLRRKHRSFSPNADGRKDTTRVVLTASERARIKIKLLRKGHLLRTWGGRHRRRRKEIVWNGAVAGSKLGDHHYKIKAVAVDRTGDRARASTSVIIDTKKPRAIPHGVPAEPVSGRHKISFPYWAWDRSRHIRVRVEILDALGRVDSKSAHRVRGRAKVSFRPKTPGRRSLAPGLYRERLKVTDDAGNSRMSTRKKWRVVRAVHPHVFTKIDSAGRRVALTFDDCDDPDAWRRILHTLSHESVRATFFCPGQEVLRYRALARATVRRGHDVGSHGWDHALLTGRSTEASAWRLRKDAAAWWRVAHVTSIPYFRPPYGAYDSSVLRASGQNGYGRLILWSVDPADWQNPPPSTIASRVLTHVHPGSIVIMHVRRHTATALPRILRRLKRKHLKPVNLDALFAAGRLRYFR
jgi:peptidoglycan/xylan/chitin deacetylase (PgdA/CDA1 family)